MTPARDPKQVSQPTWRIMEEKSGKKNHGGGIMEQDFWEAFGKHWGGIWEAFGRHLRSIWETYGRHLGRPSWQEWLREEKSWESNISL